MIMIFNSKIDYFQCYFFFVRDYSNFYRTLKLTIINFLILRFNLTTFEINFSNIYNLKIVKFILEIIIINIKFFLFFKEMFPNEK